MGMRDTTLRGRSGSAPEAQRSEERSGSDATREHRT
jgi:hypothetical protein